MSLTSVSFGKIIDVHYKSFDYNPKKPNLEVMQKIKERRDRDSEILSKDKDVKHFQNISFDKLRIFTGDSFNDYQVIERNLGTIPARNFASEDATMINVTV